MDQNGGNELKGTGSTSTSNIRSSVPIQSKDSGKDSRIGSSRSERSSISLKSQTRNSTAGSAVTPEMEDGRRSTSEPLNNKKLHGSISLVKSERDVGIKFSENLVGKTETISSNFSGGAVEQSTTSNGTGSSLNGQASGTLSRGKSPMFRPMNTVLRARDSPYTDRRRSVAHPYSRGNFAFDSTNSSSSKMKHASISFHGVFSRLIMSIRLFVDQRLGMQKQFEDPVLYQNYLDSMIQQSKPGWMLMDLLVIAGYAAAGITFMSSTQMRMLVFGFDLNEPGKIALYLIPWYLLMISFIVDFIVLKFSNSTSLIHSSKYVALICFGLMSGIQTILGATIFQKGMSYAFFTLLFSTPGFPIKNIMYLGISIALFDFIALVASVFTNYSISGSFNDCKSPLSNVTVGCGASIAAYVLVSITIHLIGLAVCFGYDQHNKHMYLKSVEIQKETERYQKSAEEAERIAISVLPRKVWEDLRGSQRGPYRITSIFHEGTIIHYYDKVTILFGDIVGFTQLSSKLSASTLVRWLDSIFTQFDDVVDEFGLEKIKTIGDCYMVCAGIPNQVDKPEIKMILAAQKMVSIVERASELKGGRLKIRIGIHSGKAWGGILGEQKLIYDVWSDDVTLASSMENSGKPGMIHVSEVTYERTKDECIYEQGPDFESEHVKLKTFFLKEIKLAGKELEAASFVKPRISRGSRALKRVSTLDAAKNKDSILKTSAYIAQSISDLSLNAPKSNQLDEEAEYVINKSNITWMNQFNDYELEKQFFMRTSKNSPPKMALLMAILSSVSFMLMIISIVVRANPASPIVLGVCMLGEVLLSYSILTNKRLFDRSSPYLLSIFSVIASIVWSLMQMGIYLGHLNYSVLSPEWSTSMHFLGIFSLLLFQRVPTYIILFLGGLNLLVYGLLNVGNFYPYDLYLLFCLIFPFLIIVVRSYQMERRLRYDFLNQRELLRRQMKTDDLRAKAMELLDKLVPLDVVERLKANPNSLIADFYEEAAIMFAEIKFVDQDNSQKTDLTKEQIETLHHIYTIFDRLLLIHHVEKIKSIGKPYVYHDTYI